MRFLFIGEGGMVTKCAKILDEAQPGCVIGILTRDPSLKARASVKNCIPVFAYDHLVHPDLRQLIDEIAPSVIISVNNVNIIPPWLLARVCFSINFHAGPLPSYAGMNAWNWAILNGEKDYGVAWHFINEVVDGGDIVSKRDFSITSEIKVRDLLLLCQYKGIESFQDLVRPLLNGELAGRPQEMKNRSYFSRKTIPFDGWFPFAATAETLDRLERSLSYFPFVNTFFEPRAEINGKLFSFVRFNFIASEIRHDPGSVLTVSRSEIKISASSGTVSIFEVRDDRGKVLALEDFINLYQLRIGDLMKGGHHGE